MEKNIIPKIVKLSSDRERRKNKENIYKMSQNN